MKKIWERYAKNEAGVIMVEAAIYFPIMFIIERFSHRHILKNLVIRIMIHLCSLLDS